ncbi:antiholin LrgA [Carnobacterium maltaromaticum]|uniref:antiholin-like murein hydrolase modulator LrgA n=1 Tax=Carnobacterium maltaromaticum TaxID=2751 RepID=UPI000C788EE9|nr:antiholin-like murein hydrolase modulator LrgA [Carnobacterium maltaromaticum]PLS38044.1 antiholin LrgA [Carnobacterium maltaromaticum]PLS38421.1 antiholin LrgA [Carnobacterium maltaromaticum]PLS38798.1 antiholin LrgA [Carnobacterium maltaromaticum]PLS45068.1 antiholin LrgA [Carnobacterium maltaromaticum]PLS47924.1 antiholin LrgA [Carnobacterium maltaromaticum]
METKKSYTFLQQAFVFAFIMLLANLIVGILPFPMPASVMGLILLFIALCLKIVKLEQVESLGNSLTGLISFLFVPSGISVMNSLGIMGQYGVQLVLIIIIATIILLAITGWTATALLNLKKNQSFSWDGLKSLFSIKRTHKKLDEVK